MSAARAGGRVPAALTAPTEVSMLRLLDPIGRLGRDWTKTGAGHECPALCPDEVPMLVVSLWANPILSPEEGHTTNIKRVFRSKWRRYPVSGYCNC